MTALLDFLQVLAQSDEDVLPLGVVQFLPKFIESEMNDIMVMDFFRSHITAEFQPDAMQQVDLFGRQVRSMWSQIKNMLRAAREKDLKGQLGST